jgi:hypothetical protein
MTNCQQAHKKLSDKTPWNDQRREYGYWTGYYTAVKSGEMPKPIVCPIKACPPLTGD